MAVSHRARRFVRRMLGGIAFLGLALSVSLAYRWAGTVTTPLYFTPARVESNVAIRLTDAPFAGYEGARKTWSLWAGRIDLERPAGTSLSSIQSATLTDIRNGRLFPAPERAAAPPNASLARSANGSVSAASDATSAAGPPAATFRAQRGYYSRALLEPTPIELAPYYAVQWQFRLEGNVDLQTRAGDRLQADSLTILELIHRRSHRLERRILCNAGARVTLKDVKVQANLARYNPAERAVECLGGVRGTFKQGTIQTERLFWSLKQEVIRCPETSTGVFRGMPCTWEGLTLDLKHRSLHANHFQGQIRLDDKTEARFRFKR